jgi:hypothetical protein
MTNKGKVDEKAFNECFTSKAKPQKRHNPWGNSKKNPTNASQTTGP